MRRWRVQGRDGEMRARHNLQRRLEPWNSECWKWLFGPSVALLRRSHQEVDKAESGDGEVLWGAGSWRLFCFDRYWCHQSFQIDGGTTVAGGENTRGGEYKFYLTIGLHHPSLYQIWLSHQVTHRAALCRGSWSPGGRTPPWSASSAPPPRKTWRSGWSSSSWSRGLDISWHNTLYTWQVTVLGGDAAAVLAGPLVQERLYPVHHLGINYSAKQC